MSKKISLFLSIVLFLPFALQAQEGASVEKSIFGIQAGIMSVWVNNEMKLSNTIALRSEVGFYPTNWNIGNFYREESIIPLVFAVEPRYYFDIKKRHSKGLYTANNTSAFISLKIRYHAGWLMLSGEQSSDIEIMPTYAARGNIGKHFNFEMGGGGGYRYTFTSNEKVKHGWAFNIVLRIGYTF
ncbi:MAG: hypothetical protein FWE63_06410 [Bacteroidales bacterium]|nr:hypothetical protein [Bacteroidales bacterium]